MSNIVIKVAQSEIKNDKNQRPYKTVTFGEVRFIDTPFGKMVVPATQARTTKINCYENNYLGKQDPGYADPIFNQSNPAAGGWFAGSIETRNVEGYDIPTADGGVRTVNTYTTVVFGDTDSPAFESSVKSAFSSKGHNVVDGNVSESSVASHLAELQRQIAG
jgi:hypothetical protein